MAQVELIMPKMGESIMEATILRWVKNIGDRVEVDETILEIATDKVDSEVPSPAAGTLVDVRFAADAVVPVGTVIALIATEGEVAASPSVAEPARPSAPAKSAAPVAQPVAPPNDTPANEAPASERFYSPLVRNIAKQENIGPDELERIGGSGTDGRVTKHDILNYLEQREQPQPRAPQPQAVASPPPAAPIAKQHGADVEIVDMDRMRRLIADHMVMSKRVAPHVTSFVKVDVTNMVNWRSKVKNSFEAKHGEKITFTPIFIEAVAKAIRDFPMINVSVDGQQIIVKKHINVGMAAALPSGNLIVPVIKNADHLNLLGLTKVVNDLANRARQNKLKPEDIQDGTFTLTNVGTFGNLSGTPIINQPQVAILSVGAIRKEPAVLETEHGDVIAIRQMMMMSLSYDHRVVDGALGGSFLRRVGDYLEQFDANRGI